jgi:hypothetical protein
MTYLRPIESIEEDAADIPRGDPKAGGRWSRRKPWREGLAAQNFKGGSVAIVAPDQSAALRDKLLGEVASLKSGDAATSWARGVLSAKNSLGPAVNRPNCYAGE